MKDDNVGPLRIFCVDDNDIVASALQDRLGHEQFLLWVGWAPDGSEVATQLRRLKPDVVIMDLDLPGTDTFALVENLATELPEARVVIFSGHVQPVDVDRALDCGAWGYISKNDDVEALIDGIRRIGRGEIVLSKEVETVMRRAAPSTAPQGGRSL